MANSDNDVELYRLALCFGLHGPLCSFLFHVGSAVFLDCGWRMVQKGFGTFTTLVRSIGVFAVFEGYGTWTPSFSWLVANWVERGLGSVSFPSQGSESQDGVNPLSLIQTFTSFKLKFPTFSCVVTQEQKSIPHIVAWETCNYSSTSIFTCFSNTFASVNVHWVTATVVMFTCIRNLIIEREINYCIVLLQLKLPQTFTK